MGGGMDRDKVMDDEPRLPYKEKPGVPIPMLLWCPACHERHVDEGEFVTRSHHTHACQHCGMVWRPALVETVGVQFLPGFRNYPEDGK